MKASFFFRFAFFWVGIASMICQYPMYAQIPDAQEITSKIELTRSEFRRNDPIIARFTIVNNSDKVIYVLKWNTPFEGFNADYFNITRNRERVVYIGKVVKRGKPEAGDYIKLDAKGSASVEINVAEGYGIFERGEYRIEFSSTILDLGSTSPQELSVRKRFRPVTLRSNQAGFNLVEDREKPDINQKDPEDLSPKGIAFKNCNATQQATIKTAMQNAEIYAATSQIVLDATPPDKQANATRYKTWFGKHTTTRYGVVASNFKSIYEALATKTITFHCDCDDNYYAYVYSNKPYDVYLCKYFWSAPSQGTDSQAGTIIHEVSHFTVVTGTKDHAYGQTNCKSLAKNDPDKAIKNADSHEYFAENNPAESMGMKLTLFSVLLVITLASVFIIFKFYRRS